jgi:hypothetical protein
MKNNTVHIDNFETPLGCIKLEIDISALSDNVIISGSNSRKLINSINHSIEIISFKDVKDWMRNTDFPVEDTKGWIFRITKKSDSFEQLTIKCQLFSNDPHIISSPDSGEHLDAIWIENKTDFLSIGTEDGEILNHRATRNDFMPERYAKDLGYQSEDFSFTKYSETGFETKVPPLMPDEKVYFHYLAATNPRKKSKEYPDEDDISTNLAVDFLKHTLIEKLGLDE